MKATDLRERTTEDLLDLEHSLSLDRFQNRFKNFTNRLDDTSVIKKTRRDLARVKLILLERAHGAAPKKAEPKPVKAAAASEPDAPVKSAIAPTPKSEPAVMAEKKAAKAASDKPKKAAEPKEPKAAKPAAKKAKPAKSEESK
jgi:large subunit ribosomal protein L29